MKWRRAIFKRKEKSELREKRSQAKTYWEANPEAALSNQWTANPIIGEVVYRRMSGGQTSKHWLGWVVEDYFSGKKFKNLLSLGCGTGDHEVIVAKSGIVEQIDAFDFSAASLKAANENAAKAGVRINFYQDDLNTFKIPEGKKYDLALCSGSLHHTKELDRFLSNVRSALTPNGYFIVNEYVGDCFNIYSKRKVEIINRLYECFPAALRSSTLDRFRNPTIEEVMAADPSESVRSKLILPFLEQYFNIEVQHAFGGQLLHPLYHLLDHNQLTQSDPRTETILRLLLEFEAILMETAGGLESDFCLSICRPK
jgi:O-antigen biosynthesis protein